MDFQLAILTKNREIVDPNNSYAGLKNDAKLKFFYGEQPSAKFAIVVDELGTKYTLNADDTFEICGDVDKIHNSIEGTTSAAYSGAVTSLSLVLASAPTKDTGTIVLKNNVTGERERIDYTAKTGTGPYAFTVSKTLTYEYASGDFGAVEDPLMFYSDDVTIDTENSTITFTGIDCLKDAFLDKFTASGADPCEIWVEIKRHVVGETRPRILAQSKQYASGLVRDNEGSGAGSNAAIAEMDVRYTKIAGSIMSQDVKLTGIISPTQIATNRNNYNPTGHATAATFRLDSAAAYNITGIDGGADGRLLTLQNIGSYAITLTSEDSSSDAENRFDLPADLPLEPKAVAVLLYDATSARWRVVCAPSYINTTAIGLNTTHRASDGKNHADVVLNNTHRASDGTDHANVALNDTHRASDGKNHADVVSNTAAISALKMSANTILNFTTADSLATIQAAIDAIPKNLGSFNLSLRFADGTYSHASAIAVSNFYNGKVYITGNTGESSTTLHTNQGVIFQATAAIAGGLFLISNNDSNVYITNLRLNFVSSGDSSGFRGDVNKYMSIRGCYINGDDPVSGYCTWIGGASYAEVRATYFSNALNALYFSTMSTAYSNNNDDTGTQTAYGLYASSSVIMKNGTQPTGSTADESSNAGGVIR